MSDDLDICTCQDVANIVTAALTDQPPPECAVHRASQAGQNHALNDGENLAAALGMASTDTGSTTSTTY